MELSRRNVRAIVIIVAFAIMMLAVVWNIGTVWTALGAALRMIAFFVVGLSIAFILGALMRFIETRLFRPLNARLSGRWERMRRPLALLLTMFIAIGILFSVIFMVIPELVGTFVELGEQAPLFLEGLNEWMTGVMERYGRSLDAVNMPRLDWVKIGDAVLEWLQKSADGMLAGTFSMASSIFSGIFNTVAGFVVAVYVLSQKEKLSAQVQRVLYAYLPEKRVDTLLDIGRLSHRIFCSFLTGQFMEAAILGGLCLFGMQILRFPYAPMVSALVGVTAFIPIFGALVGLVVGALLILINQGALQAFWFIVFMFVLQQVENNLIYPHVVGKRVALPGLWVLTAVMLGGNMAGILGMLISVPVASLLYTLLRDAVERRNEARRAEKLASENK
ncbi:MAG: AI-2E family transporter [Firmicutes bacterium]|nr:AI-2E family transporter [Bacillota bacterium]